MTLREAFDLYKLDRIIFKNQSVKTEENHYVCLKALVAFFGDIEVTDLTFPMVRDWKVHLDANRSPATVRNYIIRLRVVLAYLLTQGLPVLDYNQIPVPNRVEKVPDYVSRDEVATIIRSTKRLKNKAIMSLLYASGVRVSELCSLDKTSIREGRFTVVGKGGKARLCFIDERTKTLIDLYLETRSDNNPALFLTDQSKRITPGTIQDTFRSVRRSTGINCHPHTLRHSFATDLLKNNANMRYVQVLLGHSSLQTTQMYTHVVDLDLEEVYSKHHKT
jgi:site-specific recombinase XerD